MNKLSKSEIIKTFGPKCIEKYIQLVEKEINKKNKEK